MGGLDDGEGGLQGAVPPDQFQKTFVGLLSPGAVVHDDDPHDLLRATRKCSGSCHIERSR